MTDKKRKNREPNGKMYDCLFESKDLSNLCIAQPVERDQEKFQRLFSQFHLQNVSVNFDDLEKVLKQRDSTNFVIASFQSPGTDSHIITLKYSTSGDGGFHCSTSSSTITISKGEKVCKSYDLIMKSNLGYEPECKVIEESVSLDFLKDLDQKLKEHMVFIASMLTLVVKAYIWTLVQKEEKLLYEQEEVKHSDYISNRYVGENSHGIKMQALQEVNNFLYPFVSRHVRNSK